MPGAISLGVGEPDFRTPWQVRAAGIRSLEVGSTRYTSNRGLEALRDEISAYVDRKYGTKYKAQRKRRVQQDEFHRYATWYSYCFSKESE